MAETKAPTLLRFLGIRTTIVDMVSPLPTDECIDRLRKQLDDARAFLGSGPVIGRIDHMDFRLRKRIFYRNSFQTMLNGNLVGESRRTRIRCRFGLNPLVRIFILIWLAITGAIACLVGLSGVSLLLHGGSLGQNPQLMTIVIPVLLPVFGLAMVVVGRIFAREEQQFLLEFLSKQLDGREAPTFDR